MPRGSGTAREHAKRLGKSLAELVGIASQGKDQEILRLRKALGKIDIEAENISKQRDRFDQTKIRATECASVIEMDRCADRIKAIVTAALKERASLVDVVAKARAK